MRRSISTLGRYLPIMHEVNQRSSKLQVKGGDVIASATVSGTLSMSHRVKVARPSPSFVAGSRRSLVRTKDRAGIGRVTQSACAAHFRFEPAGNPVDWPTHGKNIVAFTERGHSSQMQHPNQSFERTHTGGLVCGYFRFAACRCAPLNFDVRPLPDHHA